MSSKNQEATYIKHRSNKRKLHQQHASKLPSKQTQRGQNRKARSKIQRARIESPEAKYSGPESNIPKHSLHFYCPKIQETQQLAHPSEDRNDCNYQISSSEAISLLKARFALDAKD